ncbi:unnamed protein product [Lampetra planeri]
MALDEDALAAFYGIPSNDHSSLAGVFATMQDIYEPRRLTRQWTKPLLTQEKLLLMAKELRVVLSLPSNSDDDMSSLQIARNIQTNLDLRDEPTVAVAQPLVVCAGAAGCPAELEEQGSLAAAARLPLASLPHRSEMYGGGVQRACYECGRRGHFARDCW